MDLFVKCRLKLHIDITLHFLLLKGLLKTREVHFTEVFTDNCFVLGWKI